MIDAFRVPFQSLHRFLFLTSLIKLHKKVRRLRPLVNVKFATLRAHHEVAILGHVDKVGDSILVADQFVIGEVLLEARYTVE